MRHVVFILLLVVLFSITSCTYYSAVATDGKKVYVTRNKGWIWYNGDVLTCDPAKEGGLKCVKHLEVSDENTEKAKEVVTPVAPPPPPTPPSKPAPVIDTNSKGYDGF